MGDELGDVESWDLTKCKDEIKELQNDRERRQEATERLQERLKALNNELAARRLEGEQKQQELNEQQKRNREKQNKLRENGDTGTEIVQVEEDLLKVRNVLEDMVAEKVAGPNKKDKARTQYGFRVFDETELMVDKPAEEAAGHVQPVDTVLVVYQKPNSDDVKYYLSYRVAKDTPSKKLREDACNFWNLSEVEFVLLTRDGSKVHDDLILQHCFHPQEKCLLILAPKDPTRTTMLPSEYNATKPVLAKGSKSKAAQKTNLQEEANKRANSTQGFVDWMQTKPGIWSYMIQRDRNRVDHLNRILFSSILIYASMLLLSICIIYILVPPGRMYYMRYGPLTSLTTEQSFPSHLTLDGLPVEIPKFYDIKTQIEAWHWLTYIVPHTLMNSSSEFRTHNYLNGWLRIRMQQVKVSERSACSPDDVVPNGVDCVNPHYDADTAGTEELEVLKVYWEGWNISNTSNGSNASDASRRLAFQDGEDYFWKSFGDSISANGALMSESDGSPRDLIELEAWRDLYYNSSSGWNFTGLAEQPVVSGVDGRSSTVKPYEYLSHEKNSISHQVESITGIVQSYNPSGYNMDYDLQHHDLDALLRAVQADMVAVKDFWFTNRTRAMFIHFTMYNANYDLWANCDFIFEMNVASVIQPYLHIDVFSASVKATQHSRWLFWMGTVRLIFALYAGTIQVCYELRMCREREESRWTYVLGPYGMCDIGTCLFALAIYVLRDLLLGLINSNEDFLKGIVEHNEFKSSASRAWLYRTGFQLEGPLFGFLILRTLSFLRINRHIFIVWHTMWECGKRHLPYLMIFLPIVFGFTLWAHTLYHTFQLNYTDLPGSFVSILMMALGDIDKDQMFLSHRPSTFIFAVCFYIAIVLFLINTWVAVIVWTYERVRVEAGYCPADYRWKEKHYANWMLINPIARFYFNTLRPRIDKPKKFAHDDEED